MSRSVQTSRSRQGERLGSDTRSGSPLPSFPRGQGRSEGLPRNVRGAAPPNTRQISSSSTTESRSTSSSGGSFLDRMKAPSSKTSLEDDDRGPRRQTERRKAPARSRYDNDDDDEDEESKEEAPLAAGHGYDIWSRVTTVASQLTVNVSQAWQKSIHVGDGEETPPGEESRLTKAMKAYHLAKARSPSDLPAWLFEEHERGVSSRTWRREEKEVERELENPGRGGGGEGGRGGLREIYDSVPRTRNVETTQTSGGGSRATERLRAIREAKRVPVQRLQEAAEDNNNSGSRRPPAPRAGGLPSRPVRRG